MDQVPLVDSHIHLYPASETSTLSWMTPSNPIGGQHSLSEYAAATSLPSNLKGFIFLETDRRHDLEAGSKDGAGWKFPLMEVEWLKRIALGQPKPGEGHTVEQKKYCLAIIPWAPLPSGTEALKRYVGLAKEHAGEAEGKVRGFRYLVQGKPKGTMLTEAFIEGLKWLGRNGFSFDHGTDQHRDGDWVLDETVEMITRAHEGVPENEKVTFILDHLCKPDMTLFEDGNVQQNPSFIKWRESIYKLSSFSSTYVKLSGCLSEIPVDSNLEPEQLCHAIMPWLSVVLAAFGPFRIMFGSDWPVCTIGRGKDAWKNWNWIVRRFCELENLGLEELSMLWSGTAVRAYKLSQLA